MGEYKFLPAIHSPKDVKRLTEEEIPQLCAEIREKLVEVVSVNGGHLSPNLGVVELTVALHRSLRRAFTMILIQVTAAPLSRQRSESPTQSCSAATTATRSR